MCVGVGVGVCLCLGGCVTRERKKRNIEKRKIKRNKLLKIKLKRQKLKEKTIHRSNKNIEREAQRSNITRHKVCVSEKERERE